MDFRYRIINDEAVLYEYIGDVKRTSIVIPELIDGYRVTRLFGEVFKQKRFLSEILIPNSIKDIYTYTFYYCKNLTSINGIKLNEGLNIINNRFILENQTIYKIKYGICGDYTSNYGTDKMYFIDGNTFIGDFVELK